MGVILFVDMLGGRRRWQDGGVAEATRAFYRFKSRVNTAARRAPAGEILDGVIESDAAMLVCRSALEATRIARRLYVEAFLTGRINPNTPRLWYRWMYRSARRRRFPKGRCDAPSPHRFRDSISVL